MESQLDALQRTLSGLHEQNKLAKEQRKRPAYFTNAVLRSGPQEILDLIRDADQLEASLFTCPPQDDPKDRNITQSIPLPRSIHIPTPLRKSASEVPDEHNARYFLLAAEKLMSTYHNAPRARKHIRTLLKRESEVQRHIQRYTSTIQNAKAQQSTPSKEKTDRVRESHAQQFRKVQDEIQKEKMEILALESMLAELETSSSSTLSASQQDEMANDDNAKNRVYEKQTKKVTNSDPSLPQTNLGAKQSPTQRSIHNKNTLNSASGSARQRASRPLSASMRTPGSKLAGAPSQSTNQPPRTPGPSTPSRADQNRSVQRRTPEQTPATARFRRTLDGTPRFQGNSAMSKSVSKTPPPRNLHLRQNLSQSVASPITTPQLTSASPSAASTSRSQSSKQSGKAIPQRVPVSPSIGTRRNGVSTPSTPQASPKRANVSTPRSLGDSLHASTTSSPKRQGLIPMGRTPEPSDELERITSVLWDRFRESLRYVTTAEHAPFRETFHLLSTLELCGRDPENTEDATLQDNANEIAPVPSGASTTSTQSNGTSLEISSPLSANTVVMAHVILLLFRSPPTHSLTLPAIKTLTDSWWRQRGQAVFRTTATLPSTSCAEMIRNAGLDASEVELTGDNLGSRAVYGLIAKKILRIHRAGGAATIRFA